MRVLGRLPAPLAHAAGAALGNTFYVLGGRDDSLSGQKRAIWAIDPASGRGAGRAASRQRCRTSSAVAVGGRIVVVGGRDAGGGVHDEVLELAPR